MAFEYSLKSINHQPSLKDLLEILHDLPLKYREIGYFETMTHDVKASNSYIFQYPIVISPINQIHFYRGLIVISSESKASGSTLLEQKFISLWLKTILTLNTS